MHGVGYDWGVVLGEGEVFYGVGVDLGVDFYDGGVYAVGDECRWRGTDAETAEIPIR